MRIANIMFGRGLGGIEQAFLDYNEALLLAEHEVLAITHPLAAINTEISGNLTHETIGNRGSWDLLCAHRLKKLYARWKPDLLISHGNRAIALNLLADTGIFHAGVTHNYQLRRFAWLDGVLATTRDLHHAALRAGVEETQIRSLPNMVRLPAALKTPAHTPLVIGALGRMVEKKGFAQLLEAAALLRKQGHISKSSQDLDISVQGAAQSEGDWGSIPQRTECNKYNFRLLLGGKGTQETKLKALCRSLKLEDCVEFCGWVEDKARFFQQIDIFCLPSLHEPFGIVLLEAMAHGRPVVGFRSEGPAEIIQHNEAILVEKGNVSALANALASIITQPDHGSALGLQGREFVATHYALPVISQQLDSILQQWKGLKPQSLRRKSVL